MVTKRFEAEHIVALLWQMELEIADDRTTPLRSNQGIQAVTVHSDRAEHQVEAVVVEQLAIVGGLPTVAQIGLDEKAAMIERKPEYFKGAQLRVAVIGCGYVGLPLGLRFAEAGH